MKCRVFLILPLLLVLIMSFKCGRPYQAEIVNSSDKDITVGIKLEKIAIEMHNRFPSKPLFETDSRNGVKLLDFDTSSMIASISVQPAQRFKVQKGIGGSPDFDTITEISIHSSDTIILKNRDDMKSKFVEIEPGQFEYIVR